MAAFSFYKSKLLPLNIQFMCVLRGEISLNDVCFRSHYLISRPTNSKKWSLKHFTDYEECLVSKQISFRSRLVQHVNLISDYSQLVNVRREIRKERKINQNIVGIIIGDTQINLNNVSYEFDLVSWLKLQERCTVDDTFWPNWTDISL